ncbi:MAG: hypothetical protein ABR881_05835 [Candidatus Sulfotelmatobacter sp.]|jgi:hypothetical protein
MRFFVVTLLLLVWLQNPTPAKVSRPQQQKSATSQQPSNTDQRGTEQSPLVVKTLQPAKSQTEIEQEAEDRKQKTTNDGRIVVLTGVLALVAIGQLGVYLYQAIKLRETVKAAGEQSAAMDRHIGEAARSADAMEKIASTIDAGNKAVMRAYLTVTVGSISLYQERREPGQPDLKFETRPNLTNTGNTTARNVCIRIAADILPIPIPQAFKFPLPEEIEIKDAGIIGAHQTSVLAGTVRDFVPDEEVGEIKEGRTKALCVWGLITYEDIFGRGHQTKFGQWITWNPNGVVVGYYIAGQNDSN